MSRPLSKLVELTPDEIALIMTFLAAHPKRCEADMMSANEAVRAANADIANFLTSDTDTLLAGFLNTRTEELKCAVITAKVRAGNALKAFEIATGLIAKLTPFVPPAGALGAGAPPAAALGAVALSAVAGVVAGAADPTGVASAVIDAGAGQDAEPATPPGATTGVASAVIDAGAGQDAEPATPPGATTGVASAVIDAGAGQDAEPATPPVADPPAVSQTVLNSERMVKCMKRFGSNSNQWVLKTLFYGRPDRDMSSCCKLVAQKMDACVYCCSAWEQGSWVPTPPKFPVSFQACEHCKSSCELVGEFIGTVASILGASAAGSVAGQ